MNIQPHASNVFSLLGSQNEQFVIPSYQRRYSWRKEQLKQLLYDIDVIDTNDTHLLGSIVCLTGTHSAGMNQLELVDGQQRLTTIGIILECLKERFARDGGSDHLQDLSRLLGSKVFGGPALPKILLDTLDGEEYKLLALGPQDPDARYMNPNLETAFREMRLWVEDREPEELSRFLYKLLYSTQVIRLDVSNAKDAFKLFETINNRGLKLSPTDIIKNFLLGNAARFGEEELEAAKKSWSRLMAFLDGTDSDAFFRYFLISKLEATLTKASVANEFQWYFMNEVKEAEKLPDRQFYYFDDEEEEGEEEEALEDEEIGNDEVEEAEAVVQLTFKELLENLVKSAKAYGELLKCKTGNTRIDRHLRNLRMIKSVQTYGLLMHLRVGGIEDKSFIKILKLTENFMLRRHICRERSNETERLFAHLCGVDPLDALAEITEAYAEATPPDDKFQEEFAAAQYSSNIMERARYCLEQFELHQHGRHQELAILGTEDVHVEHIIPKKISSRRTKQELGDWIDYLGDRAAQRHSRFVGRIGNLTLFAGALNIVASNNPFALKKANYRESAILMTRDLSTMPHFKFSQVDARSKELAKVAVNIWPAPEAA